MTVMTVLDDENVSTTNSTTWEEIASKEFTLEQAGDFILFFGVEITNVATNRIAGVRLMLDVTDELFFSTSMPDVAGEYKIIGKPRDKHIEAGLHTISLQGRTSNASYATSIRRKTLVVMKH